MNFVKSVSEERWEIAQKGELRIWEAEPSDGDDWNLWWANKFDNYSFLKTQKVFESIYEVGCGPYAKNLDIILKILDYKPKRIILEDPLLESYFNIGKSIKRFSNDPSVYYLSTPMEKTNFKKLGIENVDLVICNNVLDHVQDVDKCFQHISESLNKEGILILGQDLTSVDDFIKYPNADEFHPIRLSEENIREYLKEYQPIFNKILPREDGRNPDAHCSTILFCGKKK